MNEALRFTVNDIREWTKNKEVAIPALQRGLVWNPSQIELLWDSIMRGIPIGSFVVSGYIESQDNNKNRNIKYHLLDGQQRVNAIQLAFDDFIKTGNKKQSILWLDLSMKKIPASSSRNFLFRLTTPAHPWGYSASDSADVLPARKIRDWLWKYGNYDTGAENYVSPKPSDIQPIESEYPIPFSLLFNSFEKNGHLLMSENLIEELAQYKGKKWAQNATRALKKNKIDLTELNKGLLTVSESVILALRVPDGLMSLSEYKTRLCNPTMRKRLRTNKKKKN